MTTKSSRWSSGFTVALVVGLLLACGGIRQDEFICENAVAHLADCCPGFSPSTIECHYDTSCLGTTYPELDETQGECILSESCAALGANGVCARVGALPDEGLQEAGTSPPVCAALPAPDAAGVAEDGSTVAPSIECLTAADCAGGQVCCALFKPVVASFVCAAAPCLLGLQSCGSSLECAPGETCQAPGNTPVRVCAPTVALSDAQSDAAMIDATSTDASSDAPSDANNVQTAGDAGAVPDGGLADSGVADAGADAPTEAGGP
jgi:hypothetical protein